MSFRNSEAFFVAVNFPYNTTSDDAIKSLKLNNFETMKTQEIKFDTAHLFMHVIQ